MDYKEKVISLLDSKELSQEQKEKLELIFPELKESEDEGIGKEIVNFINHRKAMGSITPEESKRTGSWIAWLEKQGGQKPADKVEPKFKVGDVLCDYHEAYDNPLIFILKKFEHVDFGLVRPSDYSSYCFLTAGDIQKFKEGTYHHMHNIHHATKEQRDLLFKKMKAAGYEWDAEKKELKKIEQIELIEHVEHGKYYYCIKDYYRGGCKRVSKGEVVQALRGMNMMALGVKANEYFIPVKCIIDNRSAWGEDDEKYLKLAIDNFQTLGNSFLTTWLKSLKERVQPKQEWSEEDKNRINRLIAYFEDKESFTAEDDIVYSNWLKSIRPQK